MKDSTLEALSEDALEVGNLDGNGTITINEARKIKQAALGLVVLEKCPEVPAVDSPDDEIEI